jgi:nicotinate-nucleotide pyrophosphorylase (carboxylating)
MDWDAPYIEELITAALGEDVGAGDATVAAIVSPTTSATARIVALQDVVCAGLPFVERIFSRLDAEVCVELQVMDGQKVAHDTNLATLNGNAGAILSGERTVLNVLSRLSGIATLTREYVDRIAGTGAKIRDTRVTTPGLRQVEQYAIQMGGGAHHHAGQFDAIVVTRAHVAAAGGVKAALDQVHSHASRLMNPLALSAYEATGTMPAEMECSSLPIQIEVGGEAELREALSAGAESILLMEMTAHKTRELVEVARGLRSDCVIEFGGDISVVDAIAYAETGVDYVAPRALTAGAPWARLRLLVDAFQ